MIERTNLSGFEGASHATGTSISAPWWELAGRFALSGALGLPGTFFLTMQALKLQAGTTEIRMALPVMVFAGCLLLLASQVAFGRTLLPGLVLGTYVGYIVSRVFMGAAPVSLNGAAGVHLLASTLGIVWIVGRRAGVRRRTLLPVQAAAIGLAIVCLGSLPFAATEIGRSLGEALTPAGMGPAITQGEQIPDIRLTTLAGDAETLHDPGVVYVVSFWATWCAPCLLELPELAEAARRAAGDPSVRFLAVNTEDLPAEKVRAFLDARGITGLAVYRDAAEAMQALGVRSIPFTLLVLDGRVIRRFDGYRPGIGGEIEAAIAARRAEPVHSSEAGS